MSKNLSRLVFVNYSKKKRKRIAQKKNNLRKIFITVCRPIGNAAQKMNYANESHWWFGAIAKKENELTPRQARAYVEREKKKHAPKIQCWLKHHCQTDDWNVFWWLLYAWLVYALMYPAKHFSYSLFSFIRIFWSLSIPSIIPLDYYPTVWLDCDFSVYFCIKI